jgi:hypothetical protein
MRTFVNSNRLLVTWTPRSEWARACGRWADLELGTGKRYAYARALGFEFVWFREPRR